MPSRRMKTVANATAGIVKKVESVLNSGTNSLLMPPRILQQPSIGLPPVPKQEHRWPTAPATTITLCYVLRNASVTSPMVCRTDARKRKER